MGERKGSRNPGSRASGIGAPVIDGWQPSAGATALEQPVEAESLNNPGLVPATPNKKSYTPPPHPFGRSYVNKIGKRKAPKKPSSCASGFKASVDEGWQPCADAGNFTTAELAAAWNMSITGFAQLPPNEKSFTPPVENDKSSTIVPSPPEVTLAWGNYVWVPTQDTTQVEQVSFDTQNPATSTQETPDTQSQAVAASLKSWAEFAKTEKSNSPDLTPQAQNWHSSAATQNSTSVTPWAQMTQKGKFVTRVQNGKPNAVPRDSVAAGARKNKWAQTVQSSSPDTPSLAALTHTSVAQTVQSTTNLPKSAKNKKLATPSLPTSASNEEPHWDTHNEYGNMTKEQIATAEAHKAVKQVAKDKRDAMDALLKGWPWKGVPAQLVTAGPLYLNTWAYVMKEEFHEQKNCPLIQALVTSGVGELIIDLLFQHHASIWQLAMTCQKAQSFVKVTLGFWDLNICHFNGCEEPPTPNGDVEGKGLVATNLVIAPMRSPKVVELHESNQFYENQFNSTYTLALTVKFRAENFRRIHLHRVPFLTTNLLEVLIPQMTNLEVLGVYKCPLIHIGCGMDLLHLISVDRPKGKEYQVSLDWFPNFHVGPDPENCPSEFITGAFGATWDDWYGDTDRAIWALVIPFLSKCKVHGIDAVSTHTQFRRWLEAGPCWDVTNTLKAIVLAWNLQIPGSDLFRGDGNIDLAFNTTEQPFPIRRLNKPVPKADYATKFPKLTRAVIQMDRRNNQHFGNYAQFFDDCLQLKHARPEGYEWRFRHLDCMGCDNLLPGICFLFPEIKAYLESTNHGANPDNGTDLLCLGCLLKSYLDTEQDHFKNIKREVMSYWLREGVDAYGQTIYNRNDLNKLINNFYNGCDALKLVEILDGYRLEQYNNLWYDREFDERQNPLSAQVLNSLRGNFLGAPPISGLCSWSQHLADIEEARINPEMAKWHGKGRTSYLLGVRTHG